MQRVIHEYINKSYLFSMIEGLYAYVSDTEFMYDDVLWLDNSFKDVCKILQEKLLIFRTPKFKDLNLKTIPHKRCDTKEPEIIVCLSGGKDSAATAYYYKKKGYKVHLYHVHGINKAYGDEQKAARNIAKYLDCDLFIDNIYCSGTHKFIEHPLKNYIIANGAIHYALAKGFPPIIAFGNFSKSQLDMNEFEVCGGDCIEMWDAYKPIIRTVIPDFDIEIPLETNADTFEILSQDWELFKYAVSCMSPYRFRAHWKHRAEEKYGMRLFDNRCGVCWKCSVESMWLMDTNNMDYNEEYYLHCVGILGYAIYKETGIKAENVQDVWDNYMFYPMQESKAWHILQNCETLYRADRQMVVRRRDTKEK